MNPWHGLEQLSFRELRSLQDKKLHTFINSQVYPFSSHYRRVFDERKIDPRSIRTVDDLQKLPFTSKADFVDTEDESARFKDFVLAPDKELIQKYWGLNKKLPLLLEKITSGQASVEHGLATEYRPVFMTFTTGTTSKPVPFLYSNYDLNNLRTSGARMLKLFDVDTSKPIINLFPFAPHLAFWQVAFGGWEANVLALSTGGGKTMGTQGNIDVIMKIKPQMLLGVPSYVYHLLRIAAEQNCKMPFLKKVVLGASRCSTAFKMRMAELLNTMDAVDVSIFGTYGFTEARCAWSECPTAPQESSGYFTYPDKEIFEIIDPDSGEVKGPGEDGELVYTGLDARGSVMLRFRTGDFVKGGITHEPCPYTGMQIPRINYDITRLSDVKDLQLSKVKGCLVNMSHFNTIFSELPLVEEWQVEISKPNDDPFEMDQFIVYVAAAKECDHDKLKDEIQSKIFLVTEIRPNRIEIISMDEIVNRLGLETENKEKRILDKRPKD